MRMTPVHVIAHGSQHTSGYYCGVTDLSEKHHAQQATTATHHTSSLCLLAQRKPVAQSVQFVHLLAAVVAHPAAAAVSAQMKRMRPYVMGRAELVA